MNTRIKTLVAAMSMIPLAATAQMVPAIDQTAEAHVPQISTPISLTDKEKEALRLVREWRNNPNKPIRTGDGGVIYLFGATLPTLICAPLKACAIRLEPGETLGKESVHVGDTRWDAAPAYMGGTTYVIVKPWESGLTSSITLATNKRFYTILLKSAKHEFMPWIAFHYPEKSDRMWDSYLKATEEATKSLTLKTGENIGSLDFKYRISGDNPRWKPERVYRNAQGKTIIQFASDKFLDGAPVLAVIGKGKNAWSDDTKEIINYRPKGDSYVVDGWPDKMALVLGTGRGEEKVTIDYIGDK